MLTKCSEYFVVGCAKTTVSLSLPVFVVKLFNPNYMQICVCVCVCVTATIRERLIMGCSYCGGLYERPFREKLFGMRINTLFRAQLHCFSLQMSRENWPTVVGIVKMKRIIIICRWWLYKICLFINTAETWKLDALLKRIYNFKYYESYVNVHFYIPALHFPIFAKRHGLPTIENNRDGCWLRKWKIERVQIIEFRKQCSYKSRR